MRPFGVLRGVACAPRGRGAARAGSMGADADGMPVHAAALLEASAEGSGRDGVPLGGGDGGRKNAAARGAEQGGNDGTV